MYSTSPVMRAEGREDHSRGAIRTQSSEESGMKASLLSSVWRKAALGL